MLAENPPENLHNENRQIAYLLYQEKKSEKCTQQFTEGSRKMSTIFINSKNGKNFIAYKHNGVRFNLINEIELQ